MYTLIRERVASMYELTYALSIFAMNDHIVGVIVQLEFAIIIAYK